MKNNEFFIADEGRHGFFEFDGFPAPNKHGSQILYCSGGALYKHVVEYQDCIFNIYYKNKLSGNELLKLESDWRNYCNESTYLMRKA